MNTQQTAVVVQHLDVIAAKARKGLRKVAEGEDKTMEGWLEYGAALLEGREQFNGDREFGRWVAHHQLGGAHDLDRAAAMWAAANPQSFRETKKANPRVRTVRGLHAKWKAKDKPAPAKLEPTEDDLKTMGRLQTLAERGATEGERESAKAKLDAYASAFGDSKEEAVERAADWTEREAHKETDSHMLQKIQKAFARKGFFWLRKQLMEAMLRDDKTFKIVYEELCK